jgi:hypothetical protein
MLNLLKFLLFGLISGTSTENGVNGELTQQILPGSRKSRKINRSRSGLLPRRQRRLRTPADDVSSGKLFEKETSNSRLSHPSSRRLKRKVRRPKKQNPKSRRLSAAFVVPAIGLLGAGLLMGYKAYNGFTPPQSEPSEHIAAQGLFPRPESYHGWDPEYRFLDPGDLDSNFPQKGPDYGKPNPRMWGPSDEADDVINL